MKKKFKLSFKNFWKLKKIEKFVLIYAPIMSLYVLGVPMPFVDAIFNFLEPECFQPRGFSENDCTYPAHLLIFVAATFLFCSIPWSIYILGTKFTE